MSVIDDAVKANLDMETGLISEVDPAPRQANA
jgi:hypothetical protein